MISKIINWFTGNFKIVALGFVSLLIATIFVQQRKLSNRNTEINRLTNNVLYYQDAINGYQDNNRVLQLTIDELNQSNDSLIKEVVEIKEELNIKNKNLTQVNVINTVIRDSIRTIIKYEQKDFEEEFKLNSLTTITVSRKDPILTAKIDVKNQQTLFIEEKKEYKNKYKNWLVRFFHFDFKKIKSKQYQIVNSNPLIQVTDTRIIEVSD